MELNFTIDLSVLRNNMEARLERLQNTEPLMNKIALDMKKEVGLRFKDEKGPDGKPWKELKKSTIRQRRGRSSKALNDTGRLKNSIAVKSGKSFASAGTNLKYARIHQYGGTIQKAAREGKVRFRADKDGNLLNHEETTVSSASKTLEKLRARGAPDHVIKSVEERIERTKKMNEKMNGKSRVFAGKNHKRAVERRVTIAAHGVMIPARPFLGFSKEQHARYAGWIKGYIARGAL